MSPICHMYATVYLAGKRDPRHKKRLNSDLLPLSNLGRSMACTFSLSKVVWSLNNAVKRPFDTWNGRPAKEAIKESYNILILSIDLWSMMGIQNCDDHWNMKNMDMARNDKKWRINDFLQDFLRLHEGEQSWCVFREIMDSISSIEGMPHVHMTRYFHIISLLYYDCFSAKIRKDNN